MLTTDQRKTLIHVSGMDIELERRGRGQPLLLLYGEEGLEPEAPFIDELAKDFEVFIPSPPGFGNSERPDWISSLDDISYIYLDLVEKLALKNVPVVGFSFGGWLAAEIATKDDFFISQAGAGRCLRRQGRRPVRSRHRGFLVSASLRGAEAEVARSGKGQARLCRRCRKRSSRSSRAMSNPWRASAGSPSCTIPS